MSSWQVQDAKSRFSEFLDATIKKGPQVVTRRGVETAVLVPIGEWNRLQKAAPPDSILVSETVHAKAGALFAFRKVEGLQLKGYTEAVTAYELVL